MTLKFVSSSNYNRALTLAKLQFIFRKDPSYLDYSESSYNGYEYATNPLDWITKLYSKTNSIKIKEVYILTDSKPYRPLKSVKDFKTQENHVIFESIETGKQFTTSVENFLDLIKV